MKKVLAVLLTLVIIMGLALTASAEASYMSKITVKGLVAGDNTTLNVYQIISLDEAANNWVVSEWAEGYVTLNEETKKYEIADDIVNASAEDIFATATTSELKAEFEVPVGAYLILAAGQNATYTKMIANTYDAEQLYMAAKDVTVVAKTSDYELTKEADDKFVNRGQEVNFTVETVFPSFQKDSENKSYKIVDTSDNLSIVEVTSATIGGVDAVYTAAYDAADATKYVIDLSAAIGDDNTNAGKKVVVTYKAIVLTDEGFENTVNAFRNGEELDEDPPVVNGYTGDITITKKDEATKEILELAEFEVAEVLSVEEDGDEILGAAIAFVKTADGEYKLAKAGDTETVTTIVATEGTVKVTGLDEGVYHFTETKAPAGYSINEDGVTVTVEENETAHVSLEDEIFDTKLIALPETGGIGTVAFTVGGCVIMIAAAFLFFANRKKEEA